MNPTPSVPAPREGGAHTAGAQMCCWQCETAHAGNRFCPACGAIQPLPPQADYFAILGIDRRPRIDVEALERRYFDLSRSLHPDRYQTGSAQARIISLGNTASLNRAYRTLRDPIERGLYWLSLQGDTLGSNNNQVPAELAALVFDVQDTLEALRSADGDAEPLRNEVKQIRAKLIARRDALLGQLESNFSRWNVGDADLKSLTQDLKAILSASKYVRTLIRDVDKELER